MLTLAATFSGVLQPAGESDDRVGECRGLHPASPVRPHVDPAHKLASHHGFRRHHGKVGQPIILVFSGPSLATQALSPVSNDIKLLLL